VLRRVLSILVLLLAANWLPGQEIAALNSPTELKKLSIEDLMNLPVTTVSREPEPWFSSPSAVQVVTGEDIRRSGASSIPEALRLAPNLQVAQVNSSQWAISSRGFNNTLANKLLVMIDGRSVYTPLFAGVFWDVQDMMLEDLDRIEVVSGPGSTLWGANAVNGVINIISKNSKDTQGGLFTAGGGTFLEDFVSGRYGGQLATNLYFRVYGKYSDRGSTDLPNGNADTDAWRFGQGGFRTDWLPENGDTLTLEGNGYGGRFQQVSPGHTSVDGENLVGRWKHVLEEDSDLSAQAYWDRTWRNVPGTFTEELNTFDLDFQHRLPLGTRQSFIWGGGYRLMADRVGNSQAIAFIPPDRNMQLFSGFAQDEITIIEDRLRLTVGSKVEHNDFSGFEYEPSIRLAWTPTRKQTVWGAVSRAIRAPSRIDADAFAPAPPAAPGVTNLIPGSFSSEQLLAYELGYRIQPTPKLSFSLATFFNSYNDIRSVESIPTGSNALVIANGQQAQSWGVELAGNFEPVKDWRLRAGYTHFHKDVWSKGSRQDANHGTAEGDDPEHQVMLQSMLDLPYHLSLDTDFRYVDVLPSPNVPSYVTFDVRVAWRPNRNLEISVVGQNLWSPDHAEFGPAATRHEIPRSVYGKVTWSF
jgi:iron complex outermembrane receptor protein